MRTASAVVSGLLSRPVPALSGALAIVEIIIIVAIVGLLVAVLVLYRQRNQPAKPAQAGSPAQSYYADLPTGGGLPQGGGVQGADPFGGFGAAAAPATMQAPPQPAPAPAPVAAPPPPPPAPAAPAGPAPGTPAGWLPDPSGAPNTLRYWDGNGWTQHVAQRS